MSDANPDKKSLVEKIVDLFRGKGLGANYLVETLASLVGEHTQDEIDAAVDAIIKTQPLEPEGLKFGWHYSGGHGCWTTLYTEAVKPSPEESKSEG